MLNAIQAGIFTPSTKQRLDELEETKSQLEVSILQEEMHKPLLTREQIAFFIYRFRKFDVTKREQRQRLIDSFVNAVYLYEDKIILTFNYKDGSKTITLAEVEGSDLSVLGAPKSRSLDRDFLFFRDLNRRSFRVRKACRRHGFSEKLPEPVPKSRRDLGGEVFTKPRSGVSLHLHQKLDL